MEKIRTSERAFKSPKIRTVLIFSYFLRLNEKLWFVRLRETASKYAITDPADTLSNPMPPSAYKNMVRTKIMSWSCMRRAGGVWDE